MYDPFEGIEPAEGQTSNTGNSGMYDPFGDIEPYTPAKEPSMLDKIGNQVNTALTNMGNTISGWVGNVENAANEYSNQVNQAAERAYQARQGGEYVDDEDPTAGYEGPDYQAAKQNLYDEAIGKPAGYVTITPFVPAPVRGVAGALAAPTIVNGTVNAYDQNVANDDGTPVISTAKQTLLDPVFDPVKEAVTEPGKFAQEIADNPLNLWDKVFLPGSVAEGAARGGKAIADRAIPDDVKARASERVHGTLDDIADQSDQIDADFRNSRALKDPFDDIEPAKGQREVGTDAMADVRGDAVDPFGDIEPAEQPAQQFSAPATRTGDLEMDIYNRYREDGLTDAEAAGIVGNIAQESGFDTGAISSDGYATKGLIQWDTNRYKAFTDWCNENGRDPSDPFAQVDYSVVEMRTTEPDALRRTREIGDALTPEDAARIFRESYERPDPAQANDAHRMSEARRVYDRGGKRPAGRNDLSTRNSEREESPTDSTVIESAPKDEQNLDLSYARPRDAEADPNLDLLGERGATIRAREPEMPERVPDRVSEIRPEETGTAEKPRAQVDRMDTIKSMENDVDYSATDGAPISRKDILNEINKEFKATVRTGRTEPGARGQYNRFSNVIRAKNYGDPRVLTHELGHYLDNHFYFSKDLKGTPATEFHNVIRDRFGKAYDKLDEAGQLREGFAEFFHDYVSDRGNARKNFPTFYKEFEDKLHADKELTTSVNRLTKMMHDWNHQGSVNRVRGHIDFATGSKIGDLKQLYKDGELGKAAKRALSKVYGEAVDELQPLHDVVKEVEKRTGKKLPYDENPFLNAWNSRGWVGKAVARIQHGTPEKGIPSLKEAYRMVGEKNMKDFSSYLVALREKDIREWNRKVEATGEGDKIKPTLDARDMANAIKELSGRKNFKEAAGKLYKYQDSLIDDLVNNGMLTEKAARDMKLKYPHYVPFQRILDLPDAPGRGAGAGFVNVSNTIKKMKGSARDIEDPLENIIANTFRITQAIERNKVGQSFIKLSKIKGMGDLCEEVKGTPKGTDSSFSVWENGKKHTYVTDPEILRALKMTNEEGVNTLIKILRVPAGWLRAGATLSPEFILRNPVRDMISASLYSKHGFIPVWDTVRGIALYLKKGKEYWDYMNSGAAEAAQVSLDRNYLHGQIRELMKNPSVVKEIAKNPMDVLRAASEAMEVATRLSEFSLARKGYTGIGNRLFGSKRKPVSLEEAGIESRDITLDFGRHGKSTRSLNQAIAFWNASIQGTDKMIREFAEHPGKMLFKTAIGITIPSIALWYINRDDPRYQELPQWQKDIFWVIPGKDTLYKIPKPFELGILFGSVPERFFQYMYDKEQKRNGVGFKGIGNSILNSMLPSAFPTGQLPFIEWVTNYNMFLNRNIVPLSQQKLPNSEQYGPYTSFVARKLGQTFNLSPRKIDNTIQDLGGNTAALVNTGIDELTGTATGRPSRRWSEMPGVRGFTATPYASSDSVQRVRDQWTEQNKLYNEFKMTKKRPEGYDPKQYAKLDNAMKALQNTYKAQKTIMNSKRLNANEKRARLDKIKMQQTNIARRALGLSKVSNE